MIIYVFGNPDLQFDSLPLRILPKLQEHFPDIKFIIKDPNEEWEIPREHLYIIDTVVSINKITTFNDLSIFEKAPRISMHDFDAYANLLLLKKLGKLPACTIIGVPPNYDEHKAYNEILTIIKSLN